MKRWMCLLILMGIFFLQPAVMAEDEISVFLNGEELRFDAPPVMQEDRVLVPFRGIFEALGAEVRWQEPVAEAELGGNTVQMIIGRYVMKKNGAYVFLDVPPQLFQDRTMVPVRAIAEGLGAEVKWLEDAQRVDIRFKNSENQIPGYLDFPEVPDFSEIETEAKLISSVAYGGGLLYHVQDTEKALTEYDAVLREAGFIAKSQNGYTSYQKEDVMVLTGLRGADVLVVLRRTETALSEVVYYAEHPLTPDFGLCFSVPAETQTADSVTYNLFSLHISDLDRYFSLLKKEGFVCTLEEDGRIVCTKQQERMTILYDGARLTIQWV